MQGVWYAAVGVALVVGLAFVLAYARRGGRSVTPAQRGQSGGRHLTDAQPGSRGHRTSTSAAEAETLLRAARDEAATVRETAENEAAATRAAAAGAADAARSQTDAVLARGREQADAVLAQAREQAEQRLAESGRAAEAAERDLAQRDGELERQQAAHAARVARLDEAERRLDAREERLIERGAELQTLAAQQAGEHAAATAALEGRAGELDARQRDLELAADVQQRELERISGLSVADARAELLASVETAARREAAALARGIEDEARAEGTERARAIVVEAVQRVASAQTAESVVSVLHLPADEMKGRIIGREGRNIRSFEAVTGVNVLIDDTPEAVLLSCFDPVRREVGRLTLSKLVEDGRIHPQRIEEVYEQSRAEVDELCLRAARDALADVGIGALDQRLVPYLGRLRYRTSYGQNVLAHLVETAHIAGVMAAELGVDPTAVKRAAFLHDIGKALTHEVEGSHAIVGAALLRKYGEDELIAHAVEAHHNEVQPRTVEAVLTQASDSCSASRPGARRESVESYVKRLARIEEIGRAHAGVEKVFAMQAGREVRVMVQPAEVDDLAASVIAREIAKEIEDELTYPGQIRVTVVRESRSTEIAH